MKLRNIALSMMVIFTFVSCAKTNSEPSSEPSATVINETPTVTEIPATPTPWPTPTQNPNLLNKNALMYEFETYEEYDLKNRINDVFYSKDDHILLVKTEFYLHFIDTRDWHKLLTVDNYLRVVSFDGSDGYFRKPTLGGEYKNLLHFTWNDNMLFVDEPASFFDMDGNEVEVSDYGHSSMGDVFFIESEYQRNSSGTRVIPSNKYFYLYKGSVDQPVATMNLADKHNIADLTISPDGEYLAFHKYIEDGSILYFSSTDVEDTFSPQALYTNQKSRLDEFVFSPDSNRILASIKDNSALVIDIPTGEIYTIDLSSEEYVDPELGKWGLTNVRFMNDETAIIATNKGKLVVWNFRNGDETVYAPTNESISTIMPIEGADVLYSVGDSLMLFNLEDQTSKKIY
ncbi:MAG: hypothetical protein PWQ55_2496 [Chloroflexota bacterium]|nr:hypothetical protein [Chloroflexota bacterium]